MSNSPRLLLALALSLAACSSGAPAGSGATLSTAGGNAGGGAAGGTSSGASTSGSAATSGGASTSGSSTGSGTSGSTGAPPTCDLGCPSGYTCVSGICTGGSPSGLNLDVKTVPITGSVTVNGTAPDHACNTSLTYLAFQDLNDAANHIELQMNVCNAGANWTFANSIYAGTYKVSAREHATSPFQTIIPSLTVGTAPVNLTLDVKSTPVAGSVTVNGAAPDHACNTSFTYLAFQDLNDAANHIELQMNVCNAGANWTFANSIYPGTYKVSAREHASSPFQTIVPSLSVGTSPVNLTLDVTTVHVAGAVTVNGAAPDHACNTSFTYLAFEDLSDPSNRVELQMNVCNAGANWTFDNSLYAGTYKVSAREHASSPFQTIIPSLSLNAPTSNLVLDVKTVPVSGVITVNGAAPNHACNTAENYVVFQDLADAANRVELQINVCNAGANWTFSNSLYPGTYSVAAREHSSSPYQMLIPSLSVGPSAASVNLNVQTVEVSGSLTVNGAAPDHACNTTSTYLAFQDLNDASNHIELQMNVCNAGANWTFDNSLYAGTYKVSAREHASSPFQTILPSLTVGPGPVSGMTLDVKTVPIAGTITVNGAAPDHACTTSLTYLAFQDLNDPANYVELQVNVCNAGSPWTFANSLYAGTYQVSAREHASSPYQLLVRRLAIP